MWKHVENPIATGDLLLFRSDSLVGVMIASALDSPYSHSGIAIVIHLPTGRLVMDNRESETKVYLFETNADEEYDYLTTFGRSEITGRRRPGCRLVDLETIAPKYVLISHRRLKEQHRPPDHLSRTQAFLDHWSGRPFMNDFTPMIGPWLGGTITEPRPHPKTVFCSELVVRYLVDGLGITIPNSPWLLGPQHLAMDEDLYESPTTLLWQRYSPTTPALLPAIVLMVVIIIGILIVIRVATGRFVR